MFFIEKRKTYLEGVLKPFKDWAVEHETEIEIGTIFCTIFLFECLLTNAAFDRGVDVGIKAVQKAWGDTLEKCVDTGAMILMMPNESGKMVKTTDWDVWGPAVAKMFEAME